MGSAPGAAMFFSTYETMKKAQPWTQGCQFLFGRGCGLKLAKPKCTRSRALWDICVCRLTYMYTKIGCLKFLQLESPFFGKHMVFGTGIINLLLFRAFRCTRSKVMKTMSGDKEMASSKGADFGPWPGEGKSSKGNTDGCCMVQTSDMLVNNSRGSGDRSFQKRNFIVDVHQCNGYPASSKQSKPVDSGLRTLEIMLK